MLQDVVGEIALKFIFLKEIIGISDHYLSQISALIRLKYNPPVGRFAFAGMNLPAILAGAGTHV